MAGQPFVHEGIVGIEQIEHASILVDDGGEQQLGFAPKRLPQVLVEVGRRGLHVRKITQVEPLSCKVTGERFGLRIRKHPLHLPGQHRGIEEPAPAGDLQQLIVRDAAP